MPSPPQLTPRLEFKYRITEATALSVRRFIEGFLELDSYAQKSRDGSYAVNSCYLDSSDLHTFWHTVQDSRNRYKLRIRAYADEAHSPVFLEIKRRINQYIVKSRAMVHRASLGALLSGRMPSAQDIAISGDSHLLSAEKFIQLAAQIRAVPTAFVRYQREAWTSPDCAEDRLTMDREVQVWPTSELRLTADPGSRPTRPFGETVILEMKFNGRKPFWFSNMERVLRLERTSAAKYCEGILQRGVEGFTSEWGGPPFPMPAEASRARRARFSGLFGSGQVPGFS
jgi:hypothetical protein